MNENLINRITALQESEFTRKIVIPLVQILHPGPVEYTHSAVESGRDIVSFGKDFLEREQILCIQVKATRISTGAKQFGGLCSVLTLAKENGVTLQSGRAVTPNEVWLITSHRFPENARRQVAGSIQTLAAKNIKIVALEEMIPLLLKQAPEIVAQFSRAGDIKVAELIRRLSEHHEASAFGLTSKRILTEFFVPVAILPNAPIAQRILDGRLSLGDKLSSFSLPIGDILRPNEMHADVSALKVRMKNRLEAQYESPEMAGKGIGVKVSIRIDSSQLGDLLRTYHGLTKGNDKDSWADLIQEIEAQKKSTRDIGELEDYQVHHDVLYRVAHRMKELISAIKRAHQTCGEDLSVKPKSFPDLIKSVRDLDEFCFVALNFAETKTTPKGRPLLPLRIRVSRPSALAGVAKRILIQGPPGCGKTTFLRNLAIQLLDADQGVVYIPCSSVREGERKKGLTGLVDKFARKYGTKKKPERETVVILDGLDESTYDLAGMVRNSKDTFRTVLASTRTAHQADMGSEAVKLELDLFSKSEREEFFSKWFANDQVALKRIKKLVAQFPDIDYHTRLPLIATITAALVENHLEPSNRCEIYDNRLQLLLSRWDVVKGVKRLRIRDDKAKRRFLRTLAFKVHSRSRRSRTFGRDLVREVYDSALGSWGYDHTIEELLDDLVKTSGLLVVESFESGNEVFSFGHLSFQEHLVGEYLWETKASDQEILRLMEDPWWHEPLLFYAYKRQDVGSIIDRISRNQDIFQKVKFLVQMSENAPYTPIGAIELLRSILDQISEDELRTESDD